jgi:hypothetical protein
VVLANLWTKVTAICSLQGTQASSGKDQVSGSARRKLKNARESQSNTGGSQQLGYTALPKSREALIRMPKRPRFEGSTLIKEVNSLLGPRGSTKPGTYREALIMAANKEALQHRASILKLIPLSREPKVLAYHLGD